MGWLLIFSCQPHTVLSSFCIVCKIKQQWRFEFINKAFIQNFMTLLKVAVYLHIMLLKMHKYQRKCNKNATQEELHYCLKVIDESWELAPDDHLQWIMNNFLLTKYKLQSMPSCIKLGQFFLWIQYSSDTARIKDNTARISRHGSSIDAVLIFSARGCKSTHW